LLIGIFVSIDTDASGSHLADGRGIYDVLLSYNVPTVANSIECISIFSSIQ
jgi:hypothetical protein